MSYKNISKQIEELNISKKDKAIAALCSFILSLIIISGPLTILINLLVLTRVVNLIMFLIATTVCVFIYLLLMFYYKFISDNKIKGIYYKAFIESLLLWAVIYIILIVIYNI